MIEVLIHRDKWHAAADNGFNIRTESFHLQCGLVIPRMHVTSPVADGWDGVSYVVCFNDEKDAAWFMLAVGGKVF